MITVCKENMCTGCKACVVKCGSKAIEIKDNLENYNAVIDATLCIDCGECKKVCQVNNSVEFRYPVSWYEGWANNSTIRKNSSSGGLATALMMAFVKDKGIVYSCVLEKGQFVFQKAETMNEIKKYTGSKYVKSDTEGIYTEILKLLKEKKRVLFLGLPCQVAGIKLFLPIKYSDGLYTIDLICHGTPTLKLLHYYLIEHGYILSQMSDIKFRKKDMFKLFVEGKFPISNSSIDKYLYSFLQGINYTDNCYSCQYARVERVSDITLGDSWGTSQNANQKKKGVSLVLCQTEKGKEILELIDAKLIDVNLENAVKHNKQLNAPSKMHAKRKMFFKGIKNGKKYDKVVFMCCPKYFIKEKVRNMFIQLHIFQRES